MTLPALFLIALTGVAVVVGIVVSALGPVALVAYVALLVAAAVALVRRVRPAKRPEGRTCDCCTSTVHDPVEVR